MRKSQESIKNTYTFNSVFLNQFFQNIFKEMFMRPKLQFHNNCILQTQECIFFQKVNDYHCTVLQTYSSTKYLDDYKVLGHIIKQLWLNTVLRFCSVPLLMMTWRQVRARPFPFHHAQVLMCADWFVDRFIFGLSTFLKYLLVLVY